MSQENISFSNTKFVQVNDRQISVKKLGLIKYAQLTSGLDEIITSIFQFIVEQGELTENEDIPLEERPLNIAQLVSRLINKNVEAVAKFLNICIPDLEYDYILNEIGAVDVLNLVEAIIEINGINEAIEKGKKLMGTMMSPQNQQQNVDLVTDSMIMNQMKK